VTFATQLKRLEEAFPPSSEDEPAGARLNAEDSDTLRKVFSLAPVAFVDAWAQALTLTGGEFTPADKEIYVRAIQSGASRLKIVDALYARKWARRSPLCKGMAHDISRAQDHLALIDNLEHFAADNQAAFVRYAFAQICAREPTSRELLAFDFDLRRGVLERRAAIKKIVRLANQEGIPAMWDSLSLEEAADDPTCARTLPTGFTLDEQGRESLVFIRELSEGGWLVAPDIMRQTPTMEQRGWLLQDGWLFAGPKRSLRPGCWRVDLDILQQDHILSVDVVANAGLDVLQEISISGSFAGSFCVTIAADHRFIELRMLARDRSAPLWINPRNISMHRIS
jgi:hypothetical protein